ncbi:MAG: DUF3631 domain-containing protein [Nitrosospira sp.]
METTAMSQSAREGARHLAKLMLAKGYRPEALHEYTDENGLPLYSRIRLKHPDTGDKWIRPMKHDGKFYVLGEPEFPTGKPLYRLHQLQRRPHEVVYLVEGEKCVDALERLGLLATTSGAVDSFEIADWKLLAGRSIVIWPDNEDAGQRYARGATLKLKALGCNVRCVVVDDLALPAKGDCVDWLATNPVATVADVLALPIVAPQEALQCEKKSLAICQPSPKPENIAASDAATIARLASLPPLQYDRVRKDEAKVLGVRPDTLDKLVREARGTDTDEAPFVDVEPWPEPIDPAKLLDEIVETIRRFIILDIEQAYAAALWVALTWFIDVVKIAPLLIINAPEKECGKSQLLTVLFKLSRRALPAANMRSATLFRISEKFHPSIMIDEADTFIKTDEEMSGLINAGHTRDSAFAWRLIGDNHEPKSFSVWGAKALAGIALEKHLPDSTMSRAIMIELSRKLPHEKVARLRYAETDLFGKIASKLARFMDDYSQQVQQARPVLPEVLGDRTQDNWDPLFSIAGCAGGEWTKRATETALKLSRDGGHKQISAGNELLADIQDVFVNKRISKISYTDLIAALLDDTEKSWATYNRGKPITMRQVTKRLASYGVRSKTIRFGYETDKGFEACQFADAFARYLSFSTDSESRSNNSPKTNENTAFDVTDAVTPLPNCQ